MDSSKSNCYAEDNGYGIITIRNSSNTLKLGDFVYSILDNGLVELTSTDDVFAPPMATFSSIEDTLEHARRVAEMEIWG